MGLRIKIYLIMLSIVLTRPLIFLKIMSSADSVSVKYLLGFSLLSMLVSINNNLENYKNYNLFHNIKL